jgi:hypothetical protein
MALIAALTPHAMPRLRGISAARRRFGLALCASAMTHAWLLTPLPPTQQPQVRPSFTINARIEAREMGPDSHIAGNIGPNLAPFLTSLAPSLDPSIESIPVLEAAPIARKGRRAAPVVTAPPKASLAPAPEPTPSRERDPGALPQPVDSTWYAAHELDSYPRALAPIKLAYSGLGGSDNAGARLLLWLRIDEHGQVVEVSAGDAAIPGHWVEAARASLTTVRFTPARKDERAVKSRLLLSVNFAVP